jgi:hypothetical protein
VAALGAENARVDVYVQHSGGVSIVRRGARTIDGAPLPAAWRRFLPPSLETLPPSPGGGTPGPIGGGAGPTGGTPGPAGTTSTNETASIGASAAAEFKAEIGEAPTPVESLGQGAEGAGSLAAGIGTWLNQAQVGFIEESEEEKAQIALEAEASNIRQDRKSGSWVGVWIVLNEPAVVDLGASIFTTPDQIKTFYAVYVTQGATAGGTRVRPQMLLPGDPNRVYRPHLIRVLAPLTLPQRPASATASHPTGPKSAAELDADIDHWIASGWWPGVALALNGFSQDDIDKRVTSDPRFAGHRRDLMFGTLYEMILWPPPNRVADSIYAADGDAARLGRIDYVNFCLGGAGGFFKEAALALNGSSETDIRAYLPRDIDKLRGLRKAAVATGLDQITRLIDERRAAGSNWVGE